MCVHVYVQVDAPPTQPERPTSAAAAKVQSFVRSSKVRHIEGKSLHKSTYIDRVPPLSTTIPGDSNAFAVSLGRLMWFYMYFVIIFFGVLSESCGSCYITFSTA